MTVNRFIRNLLNLKQMAVTHFELDDRRRVLNLWVKPYKNGCRCPECNRRCRIVNEIGTYRIWRDLPIYGCSVLLWYCPKEILCRFHGRLQENIPWADAYGRVT
jgi:transposase